MRVIDRLLAYLEHHHLSPYSFERACDIANGYLKKQEKGKGTIGSEILEKISEKYRDLNLTWLLTGRGKMITDATYPADLQPGNWSEEETLYTSPEHIVKRLKDKITSLESTLADKEKIIKLLEREIAG